MDWREFAKIEEGYKSARQRLQDLLDEADALFQATQPGAIRYDLDKVQTSNDTDPLFQYMAAKQARHLDERIAEAQKISDDWKRFRDTSLQELRQSRDSWDRIYVFYFVEHVKVRKFWRKVGYCEAQIYNIVKKMRKIRVD